MIRLPPIFTLTYALFPDTTLVRALHEADHLVAPGRRQDEVGVRVIEGEQAVAPFRQLEEVGLLLHPLALGTGRRDLRPLRAVGELALGVVGLVAHRVPAAVAAEIDVARFDQLLP